MNQRVKTLRKQSLNAIPTLSVERAVLLTDFYKNNYSRQLSIPVIRALAFKHILQNKTICINDFELIVGERGPVPKATPTFPEICIHSQEDLEILDTRNKISYRVNQKAREIYADYVFPYWNGKSMRERIFEEMDKDWKDAYGAGIFTEFMEQRAPGHTVLGDMIYQKGLKEIRLEIRQEINKLDFFNDRQALEKREELKAMSIAAGALMLFARRHADKARELAEQEKKSARKKELEAIAEICEHVPEEAPRNFWEALQFYWFVHLGVITELNTWDSFNPGRLDQHLYPFYQRDLSEGSLTREKARELLQTFWIKFNNQPAPPKVGVTAQESSTYTDFCLINIGGVKEDGSDALNELSYLILDVIEEMRLLQPSSMVQLSKKNPDVFIKRALEIIKSGFGQPSVFNSDAIIQELVRQGKSLADARNGGASGCVEAGAFGKEAYVLTGYFNLTKVLEITLNNGVDPRTSKKIGLQTGDVKNFNTFKQLFNAFETQLNYFINIKIKGNLIIEKLYADYMPAPFLSIFIDDCIKNGKDYHAGGARYNSSYIQGVGLGSITDSLTALKYHIYDKQNYSIGQMLEALKKDFVGYESMQYELVYETPKYGNDENYADDTMGEVFEAYFKAIDGRPNNRGGEYRINLLPTTCHVYFGQMIGATPDGRNATKPLSEGISPVQGADRNGPTAVIKSAAKIDHLRTGGTLLNQKFTPMLLENEEGIDKLAHLIRSYFKLDGHHIQFNVVKAATLRKAQKYPEQYRDLIVRVAGYSDYFVDLTRELQDEIIARCEYKGF